MANGRPPDGGSSRSSRSARSRGANAGGLESLGQQVKGGARSGGVANQAGLQSLGDRIDRSKSTTRRGRRRKGGRGKRWKKVVIGLVACIVLVAAVGFGIVHYELGRIQRAPCPACTAVASGAPYNVLVIGSDTRVGETAAEAQQFGTEASAGGQRSDTIKIIHVDPQAGTASTLSLPRDTLVTLSGVPASAGVSNPNKLNSAFATGPNDPDPAGTGANGLVQTIQNTFGIPISHWIVVNFYGLMDAVNALGGISMDVPYPVRDYGACGADGSYANCSGLDLTTTGCQVLSGAQALSLSRSRDYEYEQDGVWQSDGSGDIGRIERQDLIIEAVVNKAKSTYNPIRAISFVNSLTHDVTLDDNLSATSLLALGEKYHAFSGSSLLNYTLPTVGETYAPYDESVEVVQEPAAAQMITQFLGTVPNAAVTPPLDQYGDPLPTSVPATTAPPAPSAASGAPAAAPAPASTNTVPFYDPRPC